MSYSAKIVADSIAENGCRLTTFEVTFPRLILAEYNTHRVFSRNTASSRALPSKKIIEAVAQNPFVPEKFPKNQSGMQSVEWLEGEEAIKAEREWLKARDSALIHAQNLKDLKVHKQIANRLLEPFMWVTSVTSSTEWNNFFTLRVDKELALSVWDWEGYREVNDAREHPFPAQYEIQRAAFEMLRLYNVSKPKLVKKGEWHLPYVTDKEKEIFGQASVLLSAGRCGKVSYLTHGETNTPEDDIDKAENKMVGNKHWSPVEHPATPLDEPVFCGNYRGWKQQRKFYYGESGEQA